jgi:hypothetical protein
LSSQVAVVSAELIVGIVGRQVRDAAIYHAIERITSLDAVAGIQVEHELPLEQGRDVESAGSSALEDQLLLLAQVGDKQSESDRTQRAHNDTNTSVKTSIARKYSARTIRSSGVWSSDASPGP